MFSLTSIIRNRISQNKSTFCAFIDMEKAFDCLDRNLLYYRLLLYKIDGKLYKSIRALYSQTSACVKVNSLFSGWFMSNSGVRQGDSLSPTLFALFINGLANDIKSLNKGIDINGRNVSILLYADDIVLISDTEVNLQYMLDSMHEWCHKWKLKLNIDKSNVMHFRPKRQKRTEFKYHFGDDELINVDKYKYLGIYLDEHITFEHCSKVLSESAGRALGGIINRFKSLRDVGFGTFDKMYETGVMSVCNYSAEIWGFKDFQCCKNIQNRAMRYYLGVHKYAPIAGMQGDLGWLATKFRRYICMVNFWNRIMKMDNSKLVKHIFNYDYGICKNNWSADMKYIFAMLDMSDVFNNTLMCNMKSVRKQMTILNNRQWSVDVNNKPKLRTYILFKSDLNLEDYVKYHMHKRHRSLFAQFRVGILPLYIETGRYDNTPLATRICKLCDSDALEDEFHFLMQCSRYTEFREVLFSKSSYLIENFFSHSDNEKFVLLCKYSHKYVSQFIENAYDKRKRTLYN